MTFGMKCIENIERKGENASVICKCFWFGFLLVFKFNTILRGKIILWWSATHLCVSWLSRTSTDATFLSKATDYFSHLHQRWEAKIYQKVALQLDIKPTSPDMLPIELSGRAFNLDWSIIFWLGRGTLEAYSFHSNPFHPIWIFWILSCMYVLYWIKYA